MSSSVDPGAEPGTSAVKVVLRVRPLFGPELAGDCKTVIDYNSDTQLCIGAKRKCFTFDNVFQEDSTYVSLRSLRAPASPLPRGARGVSVVGPR